MAEEGTSSRMEDPNDRFKLVDNSQSASHAMFWKTKLGVLIIVTIFCTVILLISSSLMFSGVAKLSKYEDTLKSLEDEIRNNSATTTPSPTGHTTVNPPEPSTVTPPAATCPASIEDKEKFDCQPEGEPNESTCLARGCCWMANEQKKPTYLVPAPVNVPQCFFPAGFVGYRTDKVAHRADGLDITLTRQYSSGPLQDEAALLVQVFNYDYNTARITIKSVYRDRWIPPVPPIAEQSTQRDVGYKVELDENQRILSVYRLKDMKKEDTPIFSINLATLIFADQYIQITDTLPSDAVYGLGDMKGPLKHNINWTRRMLYNKDLPPRPNRALYGAHPFMMNFNKNNLANGVFLKNSNAMDVVLQPKPAATFRTIGGILDFFVFIGPTPTEVFSQYQKLIGLPAMVPYWSLGFHLCRYGIWTLNATKEVYERNVAKRIPLEAQWNDIDYMENYNMFTYGKENFGGLPEFIDQIHKDGRKYVMIFDPAVSGSEKEGTYLPYDRGVEMDIFVKNISNVIVPYKVWNLKTSIFPDFSHPKIDQYWTEMFQDFYDRQGVHFDGAWIDMNEPSNQKNGTLENTCPKTKFDFPPIEIGGERIFTYTTCPSDKMYLSNFYDLHNLYAHLEARATYKALTTIRPNKRPLIISRSSSPGQGLWSGHWTGDIDSSWIDMQQSVTDIMNFAMFGMPMLGADICGFQFNTTDELCARWQALGAFYPFSRNHNDILRRDQDPGAMDEVTIAATINSLQKKYRFAPYLYTLFYRAHTDGETVFRAMMFNFPQDPATHAIEDQFMWGDGLLIAPALRENQTEVTPYLPAGVWYHYNDDGKEIRKENGGKETFPAPLDDIHLLIRGGAILPGQETLGDNLSNNRKEGFYLYVAPDVNEFAVGELFWDDGEMLDSDLKGEYSLVKFTYSHRTLTINAEKANYSAEPMLLKTIYVFGISTMPTTMWINGETVNKMSDFVKYRPESKRLEIIGMSIEMLGKPTTITFV
ncbi:lysosomal alpha-glucosidase [Galendromus occidentalis]|uniref:Lysosomal alpha-glucosidase n=1 Tax=Galendromus occidentalis TaxID=34638 RepID=A0AAJ6QNQ2_9ACAR|nr:lysosomal alpha-glucosidase [Galendromus occidentalis]